MEIKKEPLYLLVYNDLKNSIADGTLSAGEKLPTENEMRDKYKVSRDTIRRALAKLEKEGFVVKRHPQGTFVRQNKSDYELTILSSFTEQMRARGIVPSSELDAIEITTLENQTIKSSLNLVNNEKCYTISRIRLGDGEPMAYETTYIPYRLCPDVHKFLDNNASLFDIYQDKFNLDLGYGTIKLESIIAPNTIQKKLSLPNHSPILFMECLAYQSNDDPLYFVECYYIGEKYYFSTKAPRKQPSIS